MIQIYFDRAFDDLVFVDERGQFHGLVNETYPGAKNHRWINFPFKGVTKTWGKEGRFEYVGEL